MAKRKISKRQDDRRGSASIAMEEEDDSSDEVRTRNHRTTIELVT